MMMVLIMMIKMIASYKHKIESVFSMNAIFTFLFYFIFADKRYFNFCILNFYFTSNNNKNV